MRRTALFLFLFFFELCVHTLDMIKDGVYNVKSDCI